MTILRTAGIISVYLIVACCIFLSLAFVELRDAVCVAESVEPHVAPFYQFRTLLYSTEAESRANAENQSTQPSTLPEDSFRHLELERSRHLIDDSGYTTIADLEGPCRNPHSRAEPGEQILPMPTVLALRSIPTLDIDLAEHLCEKGRDHLKRCSFRLQITTIVLVVVLLTWTALFIGARFAQTDLARFVQKLSPTSPSLPVRCDNVWLLGRACIVSLSLVSESHFHSTFSPS